MTLAIFNAIKNKLVSEFTEVYVDAYMQQAVNTEDVPLWTAPALLIQFAPVRWQREPTTGRLWADGAEFTVWNVSETGYDDHKRWTNTPHLTTDASLMSVFSGWVQQAAYTYRGQTLNLIENVQVSATEWEQITSSLVITKTTYTCKVYDYSDAQNVTAVADWSATVQLNITNSITDNDESESTTISITGADVV